MPFDNQTYPETTAMKMLKLFAGGKRWIKNSISRRLFVDGEQVEGFCLMGAFAATKVGEAAVINGVFDNTAVWAHKDYTLLESICRKYGAARSVHYSVHYVNDDAADWPMIERILQEMHQQELSTLVQEEP